MPRGGLNLCTPNAAVLAADASVQQHGVCGEGSVLLMQAMWSRLRGDLAHGQTEAREWLDTPDFAAWVSLTGGTPHIVRKRLLDDYWRSRAA